MTGNQATAADRAVGDEDLLPSFDGEPGGLDELLAALAECLDDELPVEGELL